MCKHEQRQPWAVAPNGAAAPSGEILINLYNDLGLRNGDFYSRCGKTPPLECDAAVKGLLVVSKELEILIFFEELAVNKLISIPRRPASRFLLWGGSS